MPQSNYSSAQQKIAFTNTLFQWTLVNLQNDYLGDTTPVALHLRNCLFSTNTMTLVNYTTTPFWTIHDNVFDTVNLTSSSKGMTNSCNGYFATTTLPGTTVSNIALAALDWQSAPAGPWFYPTTGANLNGLRNAGTVIATNSSLYGWTTTTNQVPETNSVIDIGYHLPALTGIVVGSTPLDSDSDGVWDVLEDSNGNGTTETAWGETDWRVYGSLLGIGSGPGLVTFTPLK